MIQFLKSTFLWQFAGGFLIGAIGLFALHPASTVAAATDAPTHIAKR
ncbi:MAG: hypothetical protein J0I25_09750 [Sphingomonadales bacterium]|nr:hypothetical protein [Sphingomonadales bacterium]